MNRKAEEEGSDSDSDSSGGLGFAGLDFTDVDFGDGDEEEKEEKEEESTNAKDAIVVVETEKRMDNMEVHAEKRNDDDGAHDTKEEDDEEDDNDDDNDTNSLPTKKESTPKSTVAAPARLQFDDGSRIMTQTSSSTTTNTSSSSSCSSNQSKKSTHFTRSNDIPLTTYYEIEKLCNDIISRLNLVQKFTKKKEKEEEENVFLCKVALQFPDELLKDAPQVSWLMEDTLLHSFTLALSSFNQTSIIPPPLVFVLGDTTYGSCCPDENAALHLNADILVHYGHACLSRAQQLPVLYSFGVGHWGEGTNNDVENCVNQVVQQCVVAHGEKNNEEKEENILILYQVKYHYEIESLVQGLLEKGIKSVEFGRIPQFDIVDDNEDNVVVTKQNLSCCGNNSATCTGKNLVETKKETTTTIAKSSCCGGSSTSASDTATEKEKNTTACAPSSSSSSSSSSSPPCCGGNTTSATSESITTTSDTNPSSLPSSSSSTPIILGGLELPNHITKQSLSSYTLLYIGDATCKQFMHIILQCGISNSNSSLTSEKLNVSKIWSYNPHENLLGPNKNNDNAATMKQPQPVSSSATLQTNISSTLQSTQLLKRRYYLTQKAKLASIYGILVGTLSKTHFRKVVHQIQQKITTANKTAYTFVVGKINVNKLANFAEVDCFVLVSCVEQSLLENEREFHVPIVTPLELDVALGYRDWDGFYSYEFDDLMVVGKEEGEESEGNVGKEEKKEQENISSRKEEGGGKEIVAYDDNESNSDDDDDGDTPFFSMVSGKYESSTTKISSNKDGDDLNLNVLPGKGQMIQYKSEGAEFLRKREYRGLQANVGQDEAKAAVKGQVGIASDYGQR